MQRISGQELWTGNVGNLRDVVAIHATGIEAVLFLATDEAPAPGREIAFCRLPLVDGAGNAHWRLRLAVETAASLIAGNVPTLVCCSNGMSRSLAVVAAALAKVVGGSADERLKQITFGRPADVSSVLWREIRAAIS
jgi:protein-tyrosine phosphatase